MGLNDKQQPLPTKIVGSYIISKLSFLFKEGPRDLSPNPSPSKRKPSAQYPVPPPNPYYQQWL
jgi:hypothetical protein